MTQEENWNEVVGENGKMVRWSEKASDDKQAEKTVFVGTTIQGIYEEKRENVGQNKSNVYQIRTKEHGLLSVWDTTVLRDRMEDVPVHSEVKIEMTGEVTPKSGGKNYFNFRVFHRPAPMVESKPVEEEPEM